MSIKVNGKVVSGGPGKKGEDGKSAYQYAVDGGYTGTEEEFQSLIGTGPWLPLSGGTVTGEIVMKRTGIIFVNYIGARLAKIQCDGESLIVSGTLDAIAVKISNVKTPYANNDAANKKYVDDSIKTAIDSSWAKAY